MRTRSALLLAGVIVMALVVGRVVRSRIGLELSPESVLAWVGSLGWKAPGIYLVLVIFRQFLLLPAGILLPAGGLCFGALVGTGLGAAGILLSALMKFSIARRIGREWVEARIGRRWSSMRRGLDRGGPLVVGMVTAHPIGPMAWFHWAAGLSSIPFAGFAIAVAIGGALRAAAFSFLGSTLIDPGSSRFYFATGVLLAAILVPLVHPTLRRRLFLRPGLPQPGGAPAVE